MRIAHCARITMSIHFNSTAHTVYALNHCLCFASAFISAWIFQEEKRFTNQLAEWILILWIFLFLHR